MNLFLLVLHGAGIQGFSFTGDEDLFPGLLLGLEVRTLRSNQYNFKWKKLVFRILINSIWSSVVGVRRIKGAGSEVYFYIILFIIDHFRNQELFQNDKILFLATSQGYRIFKSQKAYIYIACVNSSPNFPKTFYNQSPLTDLR